MLIAVEPVCVTVSDKPKYWFSDAWLDANDDHTREQLMFNRKGNYGGVEMCE